MSYCLYQKLKCCKVFYWITLVWLIFFSDSNFNFQILTLLRFHYQNMADRVSPTLLFCVIVMMTDLRIIKNNADNKGKFIL